APHDRHQSLRDDLLSARGPARLPCHLRARHARPLLRVRLVGGAQAGACRAGRDGVLVLALRRRGVDRGVHRRVCDRPMTPSPETDALEVPAPTAWPMVLGLGVTLPVERVEHLPLRPHAERARPIVPSTIAVGRLRLGEGGHRMRLPVEVPPLSAGVVGGLVGGVVMAVVALAYGLIAQGSLWYPVNLLSAAAMPAMARASVVE